MQHRSLALHLALTTSLLCATTACTSVSRGLGKLTANEHASAQSGSVWVVPPPQLDPPSSADRTLYVSYRNLSDADVDLEPLLVEAARKDGWTLVDDPQTANYRLRAQTRFFGEVEPDSGGVQAAERMGWISGAAVGVGTGVLVADATDSAAWGWAAGAAGGALAGLGVSNASKTREWALVTDFVLEERTEDPIEVEFVANDSARGTSAANESSGRVRETSQNQTSNSNSTRMTKVQNYYPHGVRLSAWANQMNMSAGEAMPLIVERTQKVVRQMLPQ